MLGKIFNKLNRYDLSLYLVFLIIISFPFSNKIILFFRFQDFFLILFIILNFSVIKKKEKYFILLLIFILVLTNLIGVVYFNDFNYKKLAIFYKIIFPVIFIFQFKNFIDDRNYKKIQKVFDYVMFCYFMYVIISSRPYSISFPLISENYRWDTHLMGFVSSLFLTFKIFFNFYKRKYFFFLNYFFLFFILMYIFKSRIFIFFLLLILFFIFYFYRKKIISYLFLIGFVVLFYFIISNYYSTRLLQLYEISTFIKLVNYHILDLGIHSERVIRFFELFPDNLIFLFSGFGFLHYPYYFIDSGVIFLAYTFGIFPLFILVYYIKKNFKFNFKQNFLFNNLLFSTILLCLIVSEFFLVSRFIYTVIIMLYAFFKFDKFFKTDIKKNINTKT